MAKTEMNLDNFDFGFSAVDENELEAVTKVESKLQETSSTVAAATASQKAIQAKLDQPNLAIEEMKQYHIIIQQCQEDDEVVLRVILNGQDVFNKVNPSPKIYETVILYGSNPWYGSFEDENLGTFENLRISQVCD